MFSTKDSNVHFRVLRPEMWRIFDKIDAMFSNKGYEAIVTCGTEAHGDDDPHTHGFALDFRSKHVKTFSERVSMRGWLQSEIGNFYTVLLENPEAENEHFHIQVRKDVWRGLL